MEITYTCRGRRVVSQRPQRTGCGFDLTPAIDALPTDGGTHEITCPNCGNVTSVTRPKG